MVYVHFTDISRLQTASACTIQTGGPHNGGGSCDFTDVNACGYAFDGYWTVFTKPYSYLGAYIPGSRTGKLLANIMFLDVTSYNLQGLK